MRAKQNKCKRCGGKLRCPACDGRKGGRKARGEAKAVGARARWAAYYVMQLAETEGRP